MGFGGSVLAGCWPAQMRLEEQKKKQEADKKRKLEEQRAAEQKKKQEAERKKAEVLQAGVSSVEFNKLGKIFEFLELNEE